MRMCSQIDVLLVFLACTCAWHLELAAPGIYARHTAMGEFASKHRTTFRLLTKAFSMLQTATLNPTH